MSTSATGESLYGYTPSKALGVVMVAVYSLTSAIHGWQMFRSRAWWLIPTVLVSCFAEVLGWAERLQSAFDPTARMPFIIQTSILVLAPTPLVAALFVGFGKIVDRLGAQYSRLKPKLYSRIFLTCDITSLLIQGAGGGICASSTNDASKIRMGSNIILVGLLFQIFCMTIFCALMLEYALRCSKDRPFRKSEFRAHIIVDSNVKRLVGGICIATLLIYARSVYRIIEFAQGFDGSLAHNQAMFAIFDGTLVALALYTLNVCHPGRLLAIMDKHGQEYLSAKV